METEGLISSEHSLIPSISIIVWAESGGPDFLFCLWAWVTSQGVITIVSLGSDCLVCPPQTLEVLPPSETMRWKHREKHQTVLEHCIWQTKTCLSMRWESSGNIPELIFTLVHLFNECRLFFQAGGENPLKRVRFVREDFSSRTSCVSWHFAVFTPPCNKKPVFCPLLCGKPLSFENKWCKHDHGLWCQEPLGKQINFLQFQGFVQVALHCFVMCSSFSHTASSLPPGLDSIYSFSVCAAQFIFHHNSSFWLLAIFLPRCELCFSESKTFGLPFPE